MKCAGSEPDDGVGLVGGAGQSASSSSVQSVQDDGEMSESIALATDPAEGGSAASVGLPDPVADEGETAPTWVKVSLDPLRCPPWIAPCGGDLTGHWILQATCSNPTEVGDECVMLVEETVFVLIDIHADGQGDVEVTTTADISLEFAVPAACLSETCQELDERLDSQSCQSQFPGCVCTASTVEMNPVVSDSIRSKLLSGDYCIEGDRLLVKDDDIGRTVLFVRK